MAQLTGRHPVALGMIGRLTAESTATLGLSGAGRLLQPLRHGGFDVPAEDFVSSVDELAEIDGSLGWLTAMFNVGAHELAALPEYVAHDVWGDHPEALVAVGHRGSGELVDGRLTGHWDSVVGAEQAEWLLLSTDERATHRALVRRGEVHVEPVSPPTGLAAAGVRSLTACNVEVDARHVFTRSRDRATAVLLGAGVAAAVVGSADGVWHEHVDQVRARLATSYGGDEVTNEAAAQVARAASDIDAARLQITTSLQQPDTACAHRQAVARARDAADRLLASSRHALDAADPVTRAWRDVQAGCQLAGHLFDHLQSAADAAS